MTTRRGVLGWMVGMFGGLFARKDSVAAECGSGEHVCIVSRERDEFTDAYHYRTKFKMEGDKGSTFTVHLVMPTGQEYAVEICMFRATHEERNYDLIEVMCDKIGPFHDDALHGGRTCCNFWPNALMQNRSDFWVQKRTHDGPDLPAVTFDFAARGENPAVDDAFMRKHTENRVRWLKRLASQKR